MTVLDELHVRNLALIEEAWLEFSPGMTVLTGETGAGKTALLGALKLLLGDRADSGAVRAGQAEALVEGRFTTRGDELLVRRRVSADGRSRCTLDGEMATVGALGERVGTLVDLHGQHDHQALLVVANHAGYLDRHAGEPVARARAAYRAARDAYKQAQETADELARRLSAAASEADTLRFVVDDIARVDPKPGEDEDIEARLPALSHAEQLAEAANDALQLLRGEGAAADRLALARAALGKVEGVDSSLDDLRARVEELGTLCDDVSLELRSYRDSVECDPDGLDALQQRLGELHGIARKYGPRLADVIDARAAAEKTLADFDAGDELLARAEAARAEREQDLRDAAATLDELRRAAAPYFVAELADAVSDLAMQGSRFEIAQTELAFENWAADGPSRIEFLFAPAQDHPARALSRIASGGELSRVMLALKSVLGEADTVQTLVFDEIDAGVGGATAHAVGRRLAELATTHQVIVVTHLAQVAAFADKQLVVRKEVEDATTVTTVEQVDGARRLEEIARMLAGNDSAVSVAHAQELLDAASSAASSLPA